MKPEDVRSMKTTMALLQRFVAQLIIALCGVLCLILETESLDANGSCTLYTFVPFTVGNQSLNSFTCGECDNVGLSHAATALMAIEHFNTRNPSIVAELDQFRDCPVRFSDDSKIFDSSTYTHLAAENLLENEVPCAVAGPFDDLPAMELSTLAAALKFPVTAHRSFNLRLLTHFVSPYTSQVFPDIVTYSLALAAYLLHKGRTSYVAVLFALTDNGLDMKETISIVLDEHGIENQGFGYVAFQSPTRSDERTMRKALEGIVESGYRTIVVATDIATFEIPDMAQDAVDLGLANGDYFWVWFGDIDPMRSSKNESVRQLLSGSVFATPFEGHGFADSDPLWRAWRSQGPSEVERLRRANPIQPGAPGYFNVTDGYFQQKVYGSNKAPEWGSAFLFDAVMATGMGACIAYENAQNKTERVKVTSLLNGIRSVNFTGATGKISFCSGCELEGSREPLSFVWGFLNLNLPPIDDEQSPFWNISELYYFPEYATDFLFPNGSKLFERFTPEMAVDPNNFDASWGGPIGKFLEINGTIYQDGRMVPPDLLRDEPEQNYLSSGVRIFGFTLIGITWLTAIASAIWIYCCRKNHVVRAAQPHFLYMLCFGSSVFVSAILTLSFDESDGWSTSQLSSACMATPWLASLGHIINYGALFSKLWRINRVLQFARRKVDVIHVIWPSALLAALALVVLILWTALDGLTWYRYETNKITGESIAECRCEHAAAFVTPLVVILLIPTVLVLYMARKTKDIDEAFSESKWIFVMVLIQLEVVLLMAPLIPLLRDVSTNGRYVGYASILWIFPMSTLCLIIGPKVFALHGRKNGNDDERKRGELPGKVVITGLATQPVAPKVSDRMSSQLLHQRRFQGTNSEGTQADPLDGRQSNSPAL